MPKAKAKKTAVRLLKFSDVLDDIAEVLTGASPEWIAEIHNQVCANCKILYVGDSLWAECLRDKNDKLVHIGDQVIMPEPNETDMHQHSFVGRIDDLYNKKGTICVVDQDDECFEIEANRVLLDEGE